MSEENLHYWNDYYSSRRKQSVPSQFAAFVANEFSDATSIVDIGCGDGRDSLFFASLGKQVVGIDGSTEAVNFCQQCATQQGLQTARFQSLNFGDAAECAQAAQSLSTQVDAPLVYARFFLHAIDEEAEQNMMRFASGLLGSDSKLCLEFRTLRDAEQAKVTKSHYRRFIDPIDFVQRAVGYGLTCDYLIEGFGMAKYKHDDAHVARTVFSKK